MPSGCAIIARRVKRWQGGMMILRWTAASVLKAEGHFRKVAGHQSTAKLVAVLRAQDGDRSRTPGSKSKTSCLRVPFGLRLDIEAGLRTLERRLYQSYGCSFVELSTFPCIVRLLLAREPILPASSTDSACNP
jgi:hypothetical protein